MQKEQIPTFDDKTEKIEDIRDRIFEQLGFQECTREGVNNFLKLQEEGLIIKMPRRASDKLRNEVFFFKRDKEDAPLKKTFPAPGWTEKGINYAVETNISRFEGNVLVNRLDREKAEKIEQVYSSLFVENLPDKIKTEKAITWRGEEEKDATEKDKIEIENILQEELEKERIKLPNGKSVWITRGGVSETGGANHYFFVSDLEEYFGIKEPKGGDKERRQKELEKDRQKYYYLIYRKKEKEDRILGQY